ncbi:MAG TPA: hypothetical protein VFT99_08385, partial [Roseiflexaceae bacterium]|nr:hypothetical protein [Roseiflexaceae bacterium]
MNHLQQYLVDEFVEDYQEGHLTRREAFKRLMGIVGAATAAQLLAACGQPAGQTAQPTTAAEPTTMAEPIAEATMPTEPTTAATSAPAPATAAATAPATMG